MSVARGGAPVPSPIQRWFPAVLVAAGVICYTNSLNAPFIFDDNYAIVNNPTLRHPLAAWRDILSHSRPAVTLSLAFNYAIGGLDVRGYHAFNLALHLLAALLLYGLVRRTLLLPQYRDRFGGVAPKLALVAALLWLVHPLQTESVTYIIQRSEPLMGLCYLLTLYCLLRGATSARRGWYMVAVVASAVGMASKEVMVTAPLVALLYDRAFLVPSWSEVIRRRWGLYGALAGTWSLLAMPLAGALGVGPRAFRGEAGFGLQGITPWQYAGSQPGVLLYYLRLSLWPRPLCLDYDWPLAHSATEIILPGLAVLALLLLAVWVWFRYPALGFLGLSFFLILAPTSSILPIRDLAFEHRLYLSLAAEIVLFILAVWALGTRVRGLHSGVLIGLACCWSWLTIARNQDYQSAIAIWSDVVAKRPANPRGHNNLGWALFQAGRGQEAVEQYHTALQLNPEYAEAHHNLGLALLQRGQTEDAIQEFSQALRLVPQLPLTHHFLGMALLQQGKLTEGLDHLTQAVELSPHYEQARVTLGTVLLSRGRLGEAIAQFQEALQLSPDDAAACNSLGVAYGLEGNNEEALAACRRAVELQPRNAKFVYDLAYALGAAGQEIEAAACYRRGHQLDPNWPHTARQLAWGLATQPDANIRNGALAVYFARQACAAVGAARPDFLDTLAASYAENGQFVEAVAAAREALTLIAADRPDLRRPIEERLHLYERHEPYRDPAAGKP